MKIHITQAVMQMKNELKAIKADIARDAIIKAKIQKLMRETANDIEKDVKAVVAEYEEINLEEHYQRIEKEAVDQMRQEVKESNFDSKEAVMRMGMLYLGYRMSRDKYIENKVDIHTIKLADEQEKLVRKYIKDSAAEELKRKAKELGMTSTEKAKKKIEKIVDDKHYQNKFSERIWRDQKELRNRLTNHINQSVAQGKNPKTWAKDLKDLVNKDVKNAAYAAERLAVTESARAQIMIQEEVFKEQGVKHWVWVAEPTACPECASYDGEVFEMGTIEPLPGFVHPWCRCSRAMVD